MDVPNLLAFLTVADQASFSMAAEILHLTQPAVSKRIAALESELDTTLFDRIGHQVLLTEAGRKLLPRARRILNEIEDTRRALVDLAGEVGGELRIGTSHHIGLHRLPEPLRVFTTAFPEVELDLRFMDSEQACRAVERGDLELAVVTLPVVAPERLRLEPVWADPLSIMVAREHPLAGRKRVKLTELVEHPAILPSVGTYTRVIVEDAMRPTGMKLRVRLSTNYLETIRMLVSIGFGWSALPGTMLADDLRAVPVKELRLSRTLGIVTHQARTLSNAGRAFRAQLLGE